MIEVHETQGVGVRCVTGGLRCVAGAGAARAPGGGARPGFATRLPAPAHTVPRRESVRPMHRGALLWLPRPRRDTEAQRCPRQASWPGALSRGRPGTRPPDPREAA